MGTTSRYRITPACAGTFSTGSTFLGGARDHPCVCRNIFWIDISAASFSRITPACAGTFLEHHIHQILSTGSPLRVQEHSIKVIPVIETSGITPACAGTFAPSPSWIGSFGDHPCVCRNITYTN